MVRPRKEKSNSQKEGTRGVILVLAVQGYQVYEAEGQVRRLNRMQGPVGSDTFLDVG